MIERARAILDAEAEAIRSIPVNDSYERAVHCILSSSGKVITSGIGKAGYVATKAASTFCTTGTPSIFLHPGDASHGDVGVCGREDVLLCFSNSGKNREVLETAAFAKKLGVRFVISITSHQESPLAGISDVVLELGPIKEACPFGLTPTASTAAMHAVADALAILVMEARGFTREEFAMRHHGGYLGEKSRA